MKLEIYKPGWQQPVGFVPDAPTETELVEDQDARYCRIELKDLHLSHAATLFLLQGASLRQLFQDVVLRVGDREPDFYSLAMTSTAKLYDPPPRVPRIVLVHILERPADKSPEELLEQIFMREFALSA